MGGYHSGRKASSQPSLDDLYSLDVCQIYRDQGLVQGSTTVIRYAGGYALTVFCPADQAGTGLQLVTTYDVLCAGERQSCRQIVRVDWLEVLNGKASRPYFICPRSGRYASKLYLSSRGFVHRTLCGLIYRSQRLGHFDRALVSLRKNKARMNVATGDAATDPPARPKGMHWRTYQKHLFKHCRISGPVLEVLADFDL